jgi:alpha-ribazole phosphatase
MALFCLAACSGARSPTEFSPHAGRTNLLSNPIAREIAATPPGAEKGFVRTRWFWIRHAPVREDGGCIYGQADVACDCSDAETFRGLGRALPRGAVWVASHLVRTHQTAAAIWNAGLEAPEQLWRERDLAEQHLGDWQGMDRAAFFAGRAMAPASYWFGPAAERAPNGESFVDVVGRVRRTVERLTARWRGRDIVAVAHGGTIRAALAIALGLEPDGGLAFAIDNCSLTRLDHMQGEGEAGWRIAIVNHQPWTPANVPDGKLG